MKRAPLTAALLLSGLSAVCSCDKFRGTAERHFGGISSPIAGIGGGGCPDQVSGRAAGAPSAEDALSCFQSAAGKKSADLMLRVTCQGRTPASCKQNEGTLRDAEKSMAELSALSWRSVLGKWNEGPDGKTVVFAIDTRPSEKRVSTLTACRIVEGDRWAICDLNEMPREAAQKKLKSD